MAKVEAEGHERRRRLHRTLTVIVLSTVPLYGLGLALLLLIPAPSVAAAGPMTPPGIGLEPSTAPTAPMAVPTAVPAAPAAVILWELNRDGDGRAADKADRAGKRERHGNEKHRASGRGHGQGSR